jgi:hypothetical protein
MNKLLVGTIALVTVFLFPLRQPRSDAAPAPRRFATFQTCQGIWKRTSSKLSLPKTAARTGTLLTKSTIRVQIIVSGKGRRLRSAPFLL